MSKRDKGVKEAGDKTPRMTCRRDAQLLREMLGLTNLEAAWLLGQSTPQGGIWSGDPRTPLPLEQAVLVRYLLRHPEEAEIPYWPTPQEVYDIVAPAAVRDKRVVSSKRPRKKDDESRRLPKTRFAMLFGKTPCVGPSWFSSRNAGQKVTPLTRRIAKLMANLVEQRGAAGLKEYLDALDEELKARGYERGIIEMMEKMRPPPKQHTGNEPA